MAGRKHRASVVRAMTFNIHHGVGLDGRLDLGRIGAVIAGQRPDLVALQEVDRRFGRRSEAVDQASWLGRVLSMHVTFGPVIHGGDGQYGNAVLTRERPVGRDWIRLPVSPGTEPRGLVRVSLPSGLRVCATHLSVDSAVSRRAQAAEVVRRYGARAEAATPTAVLGDFNATPDDGSVAELRGQFVDTWTASERAAGGATHRADRPTRRIDYVLVSRDIRPLHAAVVDVGVSSDHRAVVADLMLPSAGGSG